LPEVIPFEWLKRNLDERVLSVEASPRRRGGALANQLILARNAQDGDARVEELHDGAFSPLSQQPLVRALLLPLGSLGGTALLEYVLLPGFS
jgi:hypothetical protein